MQQIQEHSNGPGVLLRVACGVYDTTFKFQVWALKLPKNALHVRASPRAVTAGTGRPSDANQHLGKCGYDAQRRRDARSSTRQLAHSLSLHGYLGQASLTTTPSTPPKRHNADTRLTPLIMRLRGILLHFDSRNRSGRYQS